MTPAQKKTVALLYGLLSHTLFLAGVGGMLLNLHQGMRWSFGTLQGVAALLANGALVLQFPLLHSLLLSRRGRRLLLRLAPREIASPLAPTTFAALASLQLMMAFLLWSPSGVVWWEPRGVAATLCSVLYAGSWIFLGKALWDGGLALQTGSIGWTSVVRGRVPDFGPFPTEGLFRVCRQPIYLGFAATLWTGPTWTPDRLTLAVAWTVYCFAGPLFKERRYRRIYGEAFGRYQAAVPYMGLRLRRRVNPGALGRP